MDTVISKTTVTKYMEEFDVFLKETEKEATARLLANTEYFQAVLSTITRVQIKEKELKSKYF